MPDLKKYWQEVHAIEQTLPEFVWVVSLEDPKRGRRGGSIAEVRRPTAARLIHARSHRLASEPEIQRQRETDAAWQKRIFHERLRSLGVAITAIPE